MIKEAVTMKLQKKCRDQLHIPAIGFFLKYHGILLADTFKIQQKAMLPETDCQNYLVLCCKTFLSKFRQNSLRNLFAIS